MYEVMSDRLQSVFTMKEEFVEREIRGEIQANGRIPN